MRNITRLASLGVVLLATACGGSSSPSSYTVGGTVTGLSGTVGLHLSTGQDVTVSQDGTFAFPNAIASGTAYEVTVGTQPAGQTCTVANGSGTLSANVTDVAVTCGVAGRTLGGTVSGLVGSVVLQAATGSTSQNVTVAQNGAFAFPTAVAPGTTYQVSVATQPAGQTCSVANGSGTIGAADVTTVAVTCVGINVPAYPVSATVSGLLPGAMGLRLALNGSQTVDVSTNGTVTFGTQVADGQAYAVTADAAALHPTHTCTVANGSGTISGAAVTNVTVTCTTTVITLFAPPTPYVYSSSNPQTFPVTTSTASTGFCFSADVSPGAGVAWDRPLQQIAVYWVLVDGSITHRAALKLTNDHNAAFVYRNGTAGVTRTIYGPLSAFAPANGSVHNLKGCVDPTGNLSMFFDNQAWPSTGIEAEPSGSAAVAPADLRDGNVWIGSDLVGAQSFAGEIHHALVCTGQDPGRCSW